MKVEDKRMAECNASGKAEETTEGGSRYSSLKKEELADLAVSAILQHRRLLNADEAVYQEWLRASADPSVSSAVLESLQDEHLARQKKSQDQQEELSEIIEALGYVPDVPPEDED